MQTTVLLFASYADAFGAPSLRVDVPDGATVADLLAVVRARAEAAALPPAPMVAVNQRYARPATPIAPGDEVAIIPPVAGG